MLKSKALRINLLAAAGALALNACAASSGAMGEMAANAMGIPVTDAFLEYKQSVPQSAPLPIDGVWMIDNIQKQVRFEGGRAYAVDGWLHAFTLKVQPNMVVVKDIRAAGPGAWQGNDLPLLGQANYTLQANGKLLSVVKGATGVVNLSLTPVALDDPSAFAAAMQDAGHSAGGIDIPPADGYPAPPVLPGPPADIIDDSDDDENGDDNDAPGNDGDCEVVGFDPDDNPICI